MRTRERALLIGPSMAEVGAPRNSGVFFRGLFSRCRPRATGRLSSLLGRRELDAEAELPQTARLKACRRRRLDDAAAVGANIVDGARVGARRREVECGAALAVVFHEPKVGRALKHFRVDRKVVSAHALLVDAAQAHGLGTVVATATAVHAVRAVSGGWVEEWSERHASL